MVGNACRGGSTQASCCVHTYVHCVYVGYCEKWAAGTPALLATVLLEQSIYTYHYVLACVCTCMRACVCVCMHTYVCVCVHSYVCMHVGTKLSCSPPAGEGTAQAEDNIRTTEEEYSELCGGREHAV